MFLTIQNAYAILSDPVKRRAYDSTNEFDDTIPTGREATEQGAQLPTRLTPQPRETHADTAPAHVASHALGT